MTQNVPSPSYGWSPVNSQACACPPDYRFGLGQIHNFDCPLNPAKRCSRCHGTGLEPR